jgi:aminopeptidase YwaD
MEFTDLDREILSDVWTSQSLWESLSFLCDDCNGRLTGTEDEKRAGDFLLKRFQEIGLVNVQAESFKIPIWSRGPTHLNLTTSTPPRELTCMALVGSPDGDLEAEILDIGSGSESDFKNLADKISGKILLTNPDGPHRLEKYTRAQAAGAAALLLSQGQPGSVISACSLGLRSEDPLIPVLTVTKEAASYIRRQMEKQPVIAGLVTKGGLHPGFSRNIIGELPGTCPEEGWIVVCGHYDGHDLGQAAQDNGTGTALVLEAARLLAPHKGYLKAGFKFVLFAGEEEGIYGSPAYVAQHVEDWDSIRAVYNADIVGCGSPLVLKTQNSPELAAYLRRLPLTDFGVRLEDTDFINNSDHFSFSAVGISSLWAVSSIAQDQGWVHSPSDTLDKIDLNYIRAASASSARILARMAIETDQLPRGRKSAEEIKKLIGEKGWEPLLKMQKRCPY